MAAPTSLRRSTPHLTRKGTAQSRLSQAQTRFPQRRQFLALPLARRREILKAQARDARSYYAESNAWREWVSADLTSPRDE